MLRDITLGQYYPADSVIHKLDPRVKLFGTLIYIISLFVFKGLPAFILAAIFLVVLIKLSKVPFSYMVKGLKTIVLIMLFAAVFNLFLTWFHFWCRYLYLHSAVPMIWQWQWKPAVIVVGKAEPR